MADVRGFGQAGGAGGVDVERPILDGQRRRSCSLERLAGIALDVAINARERSIVRPCVQIVGLRSQVSAVAAAQRIDEFRGHNDVLGRDDLMQ